MSGYEKDITAGVTKYIQYISSPAGLIAIVVSEGGSHVPHYVYTDHLGSIVTVTNQAGTVEAEQSFDAWGRRRIYDSWTLLAPTATVPNIQNWLYRGYTGHEHLDRFGLINMNGRLYDPVVGRVLSPDNEVQNPFGTQSFNRYSYAFNNPLTYTDPDGKNPIVFIVAGLIGGVTNLYNNWDKVKGKGFITGLAYFGNGAVGGAISVVNPAAGAAATIGMNIGTDIVTGNLPTFNDGYDIAAYGVGQASSGLMVSGAGGMTKLAYNQIAKTPWNYRWANVGGGDLVMAENGFKQGVETNIRVLIGEGGASSINDGVLEKFT